MCVPILLVESKKYIQIIPKNEMLQATDPAITYLLSVLMSFASFKLGKYIHIELFSTTKIIVKHIHFRVNRNKCGYFVSGVRASAKISVSKNI